MNNMLTAAAVAGFLLTTLAGSHAAAQPAINPPIAQVYDGGVVNAVAVQPDGKVIIGGEFTHIHGVPRNNIARLNADLTLDPAWNPGASNTVHALALDGTALYVGGGFQLAGGQTRPYLAKLSTTTGAADPAWNPQPNSWIFALAVDGAGGVYAGGWFTDVGGVARNRLAKFSVATGQVDPTWNPGADATVTSLALRGGDLFVGGQFATAGGMPRNRLAKVAAAGAGAADPAWNPNANGEVITLAFDAAGNVYAGGQFTTIGGAARNYVARLAGSGAGTVDATWNPGADSSVRALLSGSNGTIYASGFFSFIGGRTARGVARLASAGAGAAEASFNVDNMSGGVHALALGTAGELYAGGAFKGIGTRYHGGFGALHSTTGATLPQSAIVLKPGRVGAVAVDGVGRVVIAGSFITAGDRSTERVNLARFNADGTLDSGWQVRVNGSVVALAADALGNVFVGGTFSDVGGVPRSNLARIDVTGQLLTWTPNPNGMVSSIMVDGHAGVIVGGGFSIIGGLARANVALVGESTGNVSPGWNANVVGLVSAMALDGDALFLGGDITHVGGLARSRLAKVSASTGTVDAAWNPAADGNVSALAADGAGSLFVAGSFGSISGQARRYLAKVASAGAGSVDAQWNPSPDSRVWALTVGGGHVYAGGQFQQIGGTARAYLTRMPGTGTGVPDPLWKPQPDWFVYATAFASGNLHVGGIFRNIAGNVRAAYAVLGPLAAPGAPTITQTMAGDAQVALFVDRGPINAGLPLTFHATCNPGGVTASIGVSPVVVRGLANGTNYTCTARASNALGGSPPSTAVTVTPVAANVAGLGRAANGMPSIFDITTFLKTCPADDPATAVILAATRFTSGYQLLPDEPCTAPLNIEAPPSYRLWLLQMLRVAYYMDAGATNLYPWSASTYWDWLRSKVGTIEVDPALVNVAGYCCVYVPGSVAGSGELPAMVLAPPNAGVGLFNNVQGPLIGLVSHEARHADGYPHVPCTPNSGVCDPVYDPNELGAYGVAWWMANLFVNGQINVGLGCTQQGRDFLASQVGFQNLLQVFFNGAKPPGVTLPAQPGGPCRADTSLVSHYYRAILRREPDEGGKTYWESEAARMTQLGANVVEAYYAMGMSFYNSAEYLAFNRNPTEYVRDLYTTFFDRAADDGGLAFWTGQMASGMPREVVLASFMFSAEFSAFMRARFGDTSARAEVDVVVDFYRGLLARLADSAGFGHWVGRFRSAQCQGAAAVSTQVESISSLFTASGEYAARSRNNSQHVGDLYNAFLRRGGDLSGVQFWISQLQSGARSREQLRRDFLTSPEFSARVSRVVLQGCLP